MQREDRRLSIEAKGETSSYPESGRFNLPFNSGQIGSHIGRAVVTALAVVSAGALTPRRTARHARPSVAR